jgi:hypothetical protein
VTCRERQWKNKGRYNTAALARTRLNGRRRRCSSSSSSSSSSSRRLAFIPGIPSSIEFNELVAMKMLFKAGLAQNGKYFLILICNLVLYSKFRGTYNSRPHIGGDDDGGKGCKGAASILCWGFDVQLKVKFGCGLKCCTCAPLGELIVNDVKSQESRLKTQKNCPPWICTDC